MADEIGAQEYRVVALRVKCLETKYHIMFCSFPDDWLSNFWTIIDRAATYSWETSLCYGLELGSLLRIAAVRLIQLLHEFLHFFITFNFRLILDSNLKKRQAELHPSPHKGCYCDNFSMQHRDATVSTVSHLADKKYLSLSNVIDDHWGPQSCTKSKGSEISGCPLIFHTRQESSSNNVCFTT
jgi:hypothetical protein